MSIRGFRHAKLFESADKINETSFGSLRSHSLSARGPDPSKPVTTFDLSKYKNMIDIISTTPQYGIILSKKIDSAEIDHLARAYLNICNYRGTTCKIIYHLLEDEFSSTQENTILRGNSLTTKLETAFCRLIGQDYLKLLFGDIILRLVSDCDLNLATTILKIENMQGAIAETRVEENRQRVLDVAQEIVDRFICKEMVDAMPAPIRAIAAYTAQHAAKTFPDKIAAYISGFLVLRFFNPAIITPEALEMLPEGMFPDKQDRQNLIAITRLLQKLSNQVLADPRVEEDWINPFLQKNMSKMNDYLIKICLDDEEKDQKKAYSNLLNSKYFQSQRSINIETLNSKHVIFLHRTLFENGIQILRELSKLPPFTRDGVEVRLDGEFLKMSIALGVPPQTLTLAPFLSTRDLKNPDEYFILATKQPVTEQSQECRFGQIVATKRNFAYFFGGSKKDGTLVNDDSSLLMYNLQSYEFIKLGTPDAPIRKYHAAALVNDKIFIFGGMYNQQCMNDMYYYNIKLQSWVKIQYRNEPPSPRYGHTMEFFENSLYIFGGYVFENEKYTYTNDLLSFSLETGLWSKIETENQPSRRMHHSSVVQGHFIWLFGGRSAELIGLSDLYRFNIRKETWEKITATGVAPLSRWAHSMNLVNEKLIIFGGVDENESYFNDFYEFCIETRTWKMVKVNKVFEKMEGVSFHSTIHFRGRLHIFFGGTFATTGTLSTTQHQIYCESFNENLEDLSLDWRVLVNCEEMSDGSFVIEKRIIYVHQLVLFTRAPVLYNLISKSKSKQLEISTIRHAIFMKLLYFIYSDQTPEYAGLTEARDIINWATLFDLADLVHRLEVKLVSTISDRNVVLLLQMAEEFHLKQMEVACILYLVDNKHLLEDFPFQTFSPLILYSFSCSIFPFKSPIQKPILNH